MGILNGGRKPDKKMSDLQNIKTRLHLFSDQRDWHQFHSAKNLSMALSVEASEIVEHFQWLTEEQSDNLPQSSLQKVETELADTFLYLLQLADRLGVDLLDAAERKMDVNEAKYPVEKSRGNAKKYSELE
jgi:NTP pyrophosphatase (non-canonical NTP hydrolase)